MALRPIAVTKKITRSLATFAGDSARVAISSGHPAHETKYEKGGDAHLVPSAVSRGESESGAGGASDAVKQLERVESGKSDCSRGIIRMGKQLETRRTLVTRRERTSSSCVSPFTSCQSA